MLSLKDLRYCPHFTANKGFAVAISRKTTKAPETPRRLPTKNHSMP